MKHSELRHQPRHVNPRIQVTWNAGQTEYVEPEERYTLPEGAEQILMTENGLYILFESAVRPYRATCRVPNDRVWLVDLKVN